MAMTEQRPKQITLDVLYEHAVGVNLKLIEHDARFDRLEAKVDALLAHFDIEVQS